MSIQFIEGLETRRFLSGGPNGGEPNGSGTGTGTGPGTGIHLQDRQQLRDGSCQTAAVKAAPTQDKVQLRRRDGSCTA